MKKLVLLLALCLGARGAGSVSQSISQLGQTSTWVVGFDWTGDASTGSVPSTAATLRGSNFQGYVVIGAEFVPLSPAPTTLYDITITDSFGVDLLGGGGANLSATVASSTSAGPNAPPLNGTFTLNLSNNSVASARGRVLVYFQRPNDQAGVASLIQLARLSPHGAVAGNAIVLGTDGRWAPGTGSGGGCSPSGSSGQLLSDNGAGGCTSNATAAGLLTWFATPTGANLAAALTTSLPNTKGGTGGDSSAATGLAHVAAGTWSYSTLVNADVAAGALIALSKLATQAADTVVANATGGAAVPTAVALLSCSAASSALTYNTTTHAFGCNSITGTGDVVGPASATDNAVVRFDSTTGKLIQNSVVTIADTTGDITTPGVLYQGGATNGCAGGSGTAGCAGWGQGTAPSGSMTNGIQEYAPTSVTAYNIVKPGTVGATGFTRISVASTTATESFGPLVLGDLPSGTTLTIASGTKALDTDAIASTACDTLSTTTATGAASTDVLLITPNADITGVTGYTAATTGGLFISWWLTTNTINWKVCNPTSSSITPGAVTLNYRIVR